MKNYIRFRPLLAVVYLAVSIFLLRYAVGWFYLASILLVLENVVWIVTQKPKAKDVFAFWLITLAAIGLSAAAILTIEKVELLIDPARATSCSISPIVACSPVITSDQASAFGFPNPILGLFGFAAVFSAGMTLFAGADMKKLKAGWWYALLSGTVFGVGFSIWLIFQAFYRINALCLYCMVVWLVSFALFWIVVSQMGKVGVLKNKAIVAATHKPSRTIALTYAAILILVFLRWQDYWLGLF